jgi:uncharacterized protein YciI
MLFALICTDRPDVAALRQSTRAAHLAYLDGHASEIVQAGALLDPHGAPCGSLFLLEAPDRGAVEAFAEADPYTGVGLFESTVIRPFRRAFKDGVRVA